MERPLWDERRLHAALALDRAADELAGQEGITFMQARRKLKDRAHILRIERRMNGRAR
jgi:hypothetical protein